MNRSDLYNVRAATIRDLDFIWAKDIAEHDDKTRWIAWRDEYIEGNRIGTCKTFVALYDNQPIGQGTLLFSPECSAINGRTELVNGVNIANINALRIEKEHEGNGHISKLVRLMEEYAVNEGYERLTIGVEAKEARNLAIYLHWGYREFIKSEVEDGVLVLYYSKTINE